MYIPKLNKIEDQAEILRFIRTYNFATVISYANNRPIATPIPVESELREEVIYLKGHLAKANPQWQSFREDQQILISFMEAHSYISSSWYEKVDVPTWNYMAIHLYGKPRVFEGEELLAFVTMQMDKYEKASQQPVTMAQLDPETLKRNLRGIVGFEVIVEDIQAKYKLSQNKSKATFQSIIQHLEKREDASAHKIATAMKQLGK